jgi:hypothetical protein
MAILSTFGALVGVLLGLHFKVLILVPVIGLAWAVIVAVGIASVEAFWQLGLALAAAVSVQLGYLAGIMVRHVFDAARAPLHSACKSASARNAVGRIT